MTTHLILGTAGHIDHGKTALIRALTGVDTDRLPEERRRGITIVLGFAELVLGEGQFRLGIIDVPGHERFVRTMLAGASGMDLAMLVVAADDSVKQQTREHLEILRLLNIQAGVIVLTKCDLVDADWIDLVEDDIRQEVAGSFFEHAPLVRTSTKTGEGIELLRTTLTEVAKYVAEKAAEQQEKEQTPEPSEATTENQQELQRRTPFRMAIDRVFTLAGHGTVVTGSVGCGTVRVGDLLVIEPDEIEVRVRSLHNHDRPVDALGRGQRGAVNLAGVHHEVIRRGHELATPGYFVPGRLLTVRLNALSSAPRPIKNRSRVRVHVGTAETLASVALLEGERLEPGESALAQLFLADAVVATWNQPFVVRSESPVMTIGGGAILDPNAEKLRQPNQAIFEQLQALESDDPLVRAAAAIFFIGLRGVQPEDLARIAGIDDTEQLFATLIASGEVTQINVSPTRIVYVHRLVIEGLCDRIAASLERMHQQYPLRSMLDRASLASRFAYLGDTTFVDALLRRMERAKKIRLSEKGISLAGQGPQLSAGQRKLLDALVTQFRDARFKPPTVAECQQQATKNRDSVPQLISLAVAEERLVEIARGLYLHADIESELREILREQLAEGQGMTLSEIRKQLDTTRKYAVPICEYLDQIGFTRREGDQRKLAEPSR